MSLLRLGAPVRIGGTVWLGYISSIDRGGHGVTVMVNYPMGQFHDGGWMVYDASELTSTADEWVAPYDGSPTPAQEV